MSLYDNYLKNNEKENIGDIKEESREELPEETRELPPRLSQGKKLLIRIAFFLFILFFFLCFLFFLYWSFILEDKNAPLLEIIMGIFKI